MDTISENSQPHKNYLGELVNCSETLLCIAINYTVRDWEENVGGIEMLL